MHKVSGQVKDVFNKELYYCTNILTNQASRYDESIEHEPYCMAKSIAVQMSSNAYSKKNSISYRTSNQRIMILNHMRKEWQSFLTVILRTSKGSYWISCCIAGCSQYRASRCLAEVHRGRPTPFKTVWIWREYCQLKQCGRSSEANDLIRTTAAHELSFKTVTCESDYEEKALAEMFVENMKLCSQEALRNCGVEYHVTQSENLKFKAKSVLLRHSERARRRKLSDIKEDLQTKRRTYCEWRLRKRFVKPWKKSHVLCNMQISRSQLAYFSTRATMRISKLIAALESCASDLNHTVTMDLAKSFRALKKMFSWPRGVHTLEISIPIVELIIASSTLGAHDRTTTAATRIAILLEPIRIPKDIAGPFSCTNRKLSGQATSHTC